MAAMADIEQPEQEAVLSVPKGGPLFDPDSVSAITSIPRFQAAVLDELQGLEAELSSISTTEFRDELAVDDLKILSEEELVQRALKEAFKNGERVESSFQNAEENNCEMLRNTILESSGMDNCSIDASDLSKRSCESRRSAKVSRGLRKKKNKKKGRAFDREIRAVELEGGYVAKVEELAKIKEKQDEDKAVAKLHSFNGMAEIELAMTTSEKIESMRSLRCITASKKAKSSPTTDYVPICYPDTVITIDIFDSRRTNLKVQEILVLGSQMLTQLRDKINCKMDRLMQKNGLHDTSAYFLIEDAFYNDVRNSSCIKYSEPIFEWLRDRKEEALEKWEYIAISAELQKKQRSLLGNESISRLPAFRAFDMHKARFVDLHFRLGCGYLYCHQGDCKHIVVVRDLRLIHPEDVQNRLAYPIITYQHRERRPKCSICNIYHATRITVDDKWARENPSYFCDQCYFLLHYAQDGSLLYDDFTVYDCYHEGMD